MAEPLDLEGLGIPGKRNTARVSETKTMVKPFTMGSSDLEIGPSGALAPIEKPSTQERTSPDDAAENHFRSRIGRRFRSF